MLARPALSQIRYLAPLIIGLSSTDSILKEEAWMPLEAKRFAFFLLGPLVVVGIVFLIPYIRDRISIVSPKRTSSLVLGIAVVVSVAQVLAWALLYYEEDFVGSSSINTIAWLLKDTILASSVVVFALLATKLVRWYGRTRNRVVLLFGGFAAGNVVFAALQILPDFASKPVPRIVTQSIGIAFMFLLWSGLSALILLIRAYYHRIRTVPVTVVGVHLGLTTIVIGSAVVGITIDPNLRTVAVLGLAMAGPVYLWAYFLLVPALLNPIAKGYYRGVGYGMGLLAAATCGMGIGLPIVFPLSGFPSLSILLPGAALAFAAFTSSASYFSISEDVRKQIRQAEGFVTSIGEAESIMSTERQVSEFYDRFTGMARASGAVEASAITKDEIYSYASALKKIQSVGTKKV